jgi:aminoglycoside phosphotransferase family enzyme
MHTIIKRSMEQKVRERCARAHAVLNMEYTASKEMLTPPAAAPMRSTSAASCRGRVECHAVDCESMHKSFKNSAEPEAAFR